MKNQLRTLMLSLGLAAAMIIPAAQAQTAGDIVADVPFAFQAHGQSLEPGTYVIHNMGISGVMRVYRKDDPKSGTLIRVFSAVNTKNQPPSLVFARYGDTHFLRKVWTGDTLGYETPTSKSEQERAIRDAAVMASVPARGGASK